MTVSGSQVAQLILYIPNSDFKKLTEANCTPLSALVAISGLDVVTTASGSAAAIAGGVCAVLNILVSKLG